MADNPFMKYVGQDEENPFQRYKPIQPIDVDPTSGMSRTDKLLAGTGQALTNLVRGAGQYVGLVNRDDVAESRRLDAPLMNTGWGTAGSVIGNMAMLAPTALIPGANTITGAGIIGAFSGAIQPSVSTDETFSNAALGAVAVSYTHLTLPTKRIV